MTPAEPTLAALPNPLLRYFLATRWAASWFRSKTADKLQDSSSR